MQSMGKSGFIQKVESQIQEHFWGENKFVQEHFRHVIRTFFFTILLTEPFRPVKQSRSQKLVL